MALRRHVGFMFNGALYLIFGVASGRFRRELFPISPSGVLHDTASALTGHLSHDDLSMYNLCESALSRGECERCAGQGCDLGHRWFPCSGFTFRRRTAREASTATLCYRANSS